ERHGVDAWFTHRGSLQVAASPWQEGAWSGCTALARKLGVDEEFVELTQEEVQARCASPAFGGGALMRDGATVQPARLARGLRRVLLERGVRIHEISTVGSIEKGQLMMVVECAGSAWDERAGLGMTSWSNRRAR